MCLLARVIIIQNHCKVIQWINHFFVQENKATALLPLHDFSICNLKLAFASCMPFPNALSVPDAKSRSHFKIKQREGRMTWFVLQVEEPHKMKKLMAQKVLLVVVLQMAAGCRRTDLLKVKVFRRIRPDVSNTNKKSQYHISSVSNTWLSNNNQIHWKIVCGRFFGRRRMQWKWENPRKRDGKI